jgi:hypothetical protein
VKQKSNVWLGVLLLIIFAATRWPNLMPPNFSAAYALVFCAGAFFPRPLAWWLPLGTMAATDIAINFYYHSWKLTLLASYAVYAALIWLGTRVGPRASWLKLLGGGLLGAVFFYLVTNTVAWLFNPFGNPEYARNFAGWFRALTQGTAGYAETWRFFLNTLVSGGLFTGLFAAAMKLTASESKRETETPEPVEDDAEPAPGAEPEEARS